MQTKSPTQPKNQAKEIEINYSRRRIISILLIIVFFVAGIIYIAYDCALLIDDMLCLSAVSLSFLLVFFISIIKNRKRGALISGAATNYEGLAITFSAVWLFVLIFHEAAEFYFPILAISVILTTAIADSMAIAAGIYFSVIICITNGYSNYVCFAYSLLVILGVLLSSYFKEGNIGNKLCIQIIYFLLNLLVFSVFNYMAYLEFEYSILFSAIVCGLINCLIISVCYTLLYKLNLRELYAPYEKLLADDFVLVREIKRFSTAEYNHALRVSRIATHCAELIGADVSVARCAGFYYRLGKLEGEPEIDNALRLANNHCFPEAVMNILFEYGGILRHPSSKESAIVHMIDAVVTKAEAFDADTMSSAWNQDMVIYQTLNEISATGLYDNSTLGMNQFLKIREFLVEKENLL